MLEVIDEIPLNTPLFVVPCTDWQSNDDRIHAINNVENKGRNPTKPQRLKENEMWMSSWTVDQHGYVRVGGKGYLNFLYRPNNADRTARGMVRNVRLTHLRNESLISRRPQFEFLIVAYTSALLRPGTILCGPHIIDHFTYPDSIASREGANVAVELPPP